jgi:hypothetical protein
VGGALSTDARTSGTPAAPEVFGEQEAGAATRPVVSAATHTTMNKITVVTPKYDVQAQALWQEVAEASDLVATIVDNIPGLTVAGAETRSELERAAALLKAVAGILQRTERREGSRYASDNRSILGPDPVA